MLVSIGSEKNFGINLIGDRLIKSGHPLMSEVAPYFARVSAMLLYMSSA